jgi:hypothetical protein
MAMGRSVVESIVESPDGYRYTRAVFHPTEGLGFSTEDAEVTPEIRAATGITQTGTRVTIPLRRLAAAKPGQFTFPRLLEQIEYCVQVRPVLLDPNRDVTLEYGDAPPRPVEFSYPEGQELVAKHAVTVGPMSGVLWAGAADSPISGGGFSRQTRAYGILVRGERAAYEVSLGTKLQTNPAHRQVFGELRLDGIESHQREADAAQDDDSQLIYKPDRSGLNPDHALVEAIYQFLDEELGPLIAALEAREKKQRVSDDVRRQLHELAKLINEAVDLEQFGDVDTSDGMPRRETVRTGEGPEPPTPPTAPIVPVVEDGIEFATSRLFLGAGQTRRIKVWFDTSKVPVGTAVGLTSSPGGVLRSATLYGDAVPKPPEHGIADLLLTLQAEEAEGRDEVAVAAGGYSAELPVYVRFPRATGFIRDIVLVNEDWESGSALYDPQTGRVKVFVGRPEFKDMAARARKDKVEDEFAYVPYRILVVESVREAALRTAAERLAEVAFDELPTEERQEPGALSRLQLAEYQVLDYKLRRVLIKAFAAV